MADTNTEISEVKPKKSFGATINGFMHSKGTMNTLGVLSGLTGSLTNLNAKMETSNDQLAANLRSGVSSGLKTLGPYGMAFGALYDGLGAIGAMSDTSKGLGGGNDFGNTAMSLLPGSSLFASKTQNYKVSGELKNSGASYSGTLDKANTAAQNAGRDLVFGSAKANAMIDNARFQDQKVQDIISQNQTNLLAANNPAITLGVQLARSGGFQPAQFSVGKHGMKFDTSFAKSVIEKRKKKLQEIRLEEEANSKDSNDIEEVIPPVGIDFFKEGGSFNVIPDGALHKNKHHLSDIDEKFEDVTEKGIPVITEEEGGEITQHAEVEINEIIFRLEVTKQLEKLMEVNRHYTNSQKEKDNAAIEAGKLLVEEILNNTHDNTGLISQIE